MRESWGIVLQDTVLQWLVPERHRPRGGRDLTGDVDHSVGDADDGDEYESSSSAEEEEFQEDELQTLSTLSEEANFLLGRVSTFSRADRFNRRLIFYEVLE